MSHKSVTYIVNSEVIILPIVSCVYGKLSGRHIRNARFSVNVTSTIIL
jgi:hypothetical protein